MIADIELLEIERPGGADFARNLLITIALFLVTITFIAARWSDRLHADTLRIVSSRLRAIRSGAGIEARSQLRRHVPDGAPTEFVELAADIDTMLATLASRNADAADRSKERRRLLRRILPTQAAQRAEAGDRNVVDQVPHASVAVIVISGLGPLLRSGDSETRPGLARSIRRGGRRFGAPTWSRANPAHWRCVLCSLRHSSTPHRPRSLERTSFVLDVQDLVNDLSDARSAISITAGIDSGPVTVGLTGGADLAFDAWGPTVRRAADLVADGRSERDPCDDLRCRRSCRRASLTEPRARGQPVRHRGHHWPSALKRSTAPMSDLFPDSSAAWAALIIVVLPLLIIGSGEVEERLRQTRLPLSTLLSRRSASGSFRC